MAGPDISMDELKGMVSTLDERLFGENTLSTRLFKSYILMGVLVFILPPLLNALLHYFGLEALFYYITMPTIAFAVVVVFIYWSISRFVTPIKDMVHALRRIETGDISVEMTMGGYVEIERLKDAVERMRNSLMIAEKYLGKRDSGKDGSILGSIMEMHLPMVLFMTYACYGVLMITAGSIIYAPSMQSALSVLPHHHLVMACLTVAVGIVLAASLGYFTSVLIGKPIRTLAIVAEDASRGRFDAEFPHVMKGELKELSQHLKDITRALEKAYQELEAEDGGV